MKRAPETPPSQLPATRPTKKGNQTPPAVELREGALAVVNVYKPASMTPKEMVFLASVAFLTTRYPRITSALMKKGYAGRLDPMARGVLLLLVGDENKKKTDYEFFPKVYEFRSVFGFSTDSYDILGLPMSHINETEEHALTKDNIQTALLSFLGQQEQAYPPYSSARVNGKFMFEWARDGGLDQITPPKKMIEIFSMDIVDFSPITMTELYEHIEQRITALKDGDFRQDLILQHWKALAERFPDKCFQTVTINASVSHGTYIRSISNDLGKALNTGATVIDLLRTSVSTFRLQNSIQLTPTQHPLNK